MAHARRRMLGSVALLLVLLLLGASGSFHSAFVAHAQNEDSNAGFDPVSPVGPADPADTVNPPRLYAGDLSHALPASADLNLGTNGYCVTLKTQNITPFAGIGIPASQLGFSLLAADPIDPTNPATPATKAVPMPGTLRPDGTLTSVAGPSVSPTANGDKFCVIAQAPVGYKTLKVNWDYNDANGNRHMITLNDPTFIPVVTVTLKASSIGNKGLICTVGWDPTFLTGRISNSPPATPNRLNIVQENPGKTLDWSIAQVSGGTVSITTTQPDANDGTQWCVSVGTAGGTAGAATVTMHFDAVYNRFTNTDDQQHDNVVSPAVNITGNFDLAHIGPNGQVLTQQVSPALVIGSTAVACILGSDAADTLAAQDISFSDASGKPDQATFSNIAIFHAGDPGAPPAAVDAGTLCFSYSSTSAGEHAISATFTDNVPTPGTRRTATWTNGPLIVQWNRIDSTVITTGGSSSDPAITYTTITQNLQFNVADGTFLGSDITLAEFVKGSHKSQGATVSGDLTGAVLRATITGGCGFFVVPNPAARPTTVTGTSVAGRFELDNNPAWGDTDHNPDDLHFGITNDANCGPQSQSRVSIDVFYPDKTTPAKPTEFVDIRFTFIPPNKTPRLAWAGQTIALTYAFSSNSSCAGQTVHFVRPENQRGTFLAGPGITIHSNGEATGDFGAGCSLTVNFTSADPGEADVEVFLDTNPFSKVGFPLFFLAFEDLSLTATPTSNVSTLGAVDVTVRGYFVGSNPSGREAVTTPDGRRLPADRWVIPDDWSQLAGDGSFRGNWGSPTLPPVPVTVTMQNETIVNSFKAGVKTGAAGYFIPATNDTTTPETGRIPNDDGSVKRPRTFSGLTDGNGGFTVNTFGDLNLSFEACAKNAINGNPDCKAGDVVGHTTYTAAVDYLASPGKFPPIASNTGTTAWTWAGFKSVTILPTDSPSVKYIVAHLVDRDGFCDAASFNNVLGVPVRFEIDAGGGTIIDAAGSPVTISQNKRFATVTTFDTLDDQGNKINTTIAQATVADDECQAWVKVSNSLLEPTNVIVTFPAQPAPVPGNIQLTGLSCAAGAETATVTNKGSNAVNLAGFALRSQPSSASSQEEHLGLSGLLAPGQSVTFRGAPSPAFDGWIRISGDTVFQGNPDYVRLVWNGFEISRGLCNGTITQRTLPNPLPADGEGELVVDNVIPFGQEKQVALNAGWNLLGASSNPTDLATALSGHEGDVGAVYSWDAASGLWKRYLPGGPAYLNTMTALAPGQVYWVQVNRPFTLTVMK